MPRAHWSLQRSIPSGAKPVLKICRISILFFETLRKSDHVLRHHSRRVNIETELIMHHDCGMYVLYAGREAPHSESELYSASSTAIAEHSQQLLYYNGLLRRSRSDGDACDGVDIFVEQATALLPLGQSRSPPPCQ